MLLFQGKQITSRECTPGRSNRQLFNYSRDILFYHSVPISSIVCLVLLTHFVLFCTPRLCAESELLQPDATVQARLAEIARTNNSKDPMEVYRAIVQLRPIAANNAEELIRQLVWYDTHKATNGEMTTIVVLSQLPELQNHVVSTLAPLMGKTHDTKTDRHIEELLHLVEGGTGFEELNFRYYENYIRGKVGGNLPFDEPFISYLFRRAPGQTLQSFALETFKDDRQKPFLWARHCVDDLLWRRQFGFVPDQQPDRAVTEQLEKMADRDEWWARLYSAEIIREHPELGNSKIVDRLKSDKNELVRNTLQSDDTNR